MLNVGSKRAGRARAMWRERAKGFGRAAGFLSLVWIAATLVAVRAARADLDEVMLGFGAETMHLAEARQQSAPTALSINGAEILVSSGMDDRELDAVLDVFEARCRASDGHLHAQLERAGETEVAAGGWLDGTLREDDDDRGYVACLDLGPEDVEPSALLERVQRFVDTGDLAAIGELRYVFAERAEHGTHFVAYWTEGSFPISTMFPSEGDAPGRDVDGVSRPPGSRRVLSARAGDEPYALTVFTGASMGVDGLERFYRDSLSSEGFRLLEPEALEGRAYESDGALGLVAERDGRMVTVVMVDDPEAGPTVEMLEASVSTF
ncbi:hypothetical protein [Sandaracinus amylolyticus]|uniref:hypothetical protein n=1 Tax=Sandaracinus amylolyticus TaxID=927083 RepID=UPI001F326425|nr:hypothetical protein [Sandaracinus amylolyticus]UJR82147.1 Hypothetical protein I5071_42120 [Sandaracinus amylolyticus]